YQPPPLPVVVGAEVAAGFEGFGLVAAVPAPAGGKLLGRGVLFEGEQPGFEFRFRTGFAGPVPGRPLPEPVHHGLRGGGQRRGHFGRQVEVFEVEGGLVARRHGGQPQVHPGNFVGPHPAALHAPLQLAGILGRVNALGVEVVEGQHHAGEEPGQHAVADVNLFLVLSIGVFLAVAAEKIEVQHGAEVIFVVHFAHQVGGPVPGGGAGAGQGQVRLFAARLVVEGIAAAGGDHQRGGAGVGGRQGRQVEPVQGRLGLGPQHQVAEQAGTEVQESFSGHGRKGQVDTCFIVFILR
ncbi:MAG: hypothetical protein AVDCRST_MAG56-5604, partial [uncultured Cytophagales bacterium]